MSVLIAEARLGPLQPRLIKDLQPCYGIVFSLLAPLSTSITFVILNQTLDEHLRKEVFKFVRSEADHSLYVPHEGGRSCGLSYSLLR